MRHGIFLCMVGILAVAAPVVAGEGDWNRFRGPQGDGICGETGLLAKWPASGPKLLWKLEGLGMGYSSVTIVDGKLFTMGDREAGGKKSQFVIAYDATTRRELWATRVGGPHRDGSRCTPTIDGDRLYAIGTDGVLVCCNVADGKLLWSKNFSKDFGGKMMSGWRWSESPLVDGDKVLCTPGGRAAAMVALNKTTGAVIWKCRAPNLGKKGKDGAGYSSIVISNAAGVKQYVQLFGRGVFGVEAETGKFLWGYNRVANGTANITSPVVCGEYVFASTQYNTGSALLKLSRDGDGVKAEEVWWLGKDQFQNHHGGVLLIDGHLYGGTNKNGGPPTCIEMKTGKIVWQKQAPAKGSAAYLHADGRFIVRYESGPVTLVEASPQGHKIVSTFTPPKGKGPAWPHPVIHDGKLYLRHGDILLCYNVKG